jgi:cation transport ATPase
VISGRAYLIGSPSLFAERDITLETAHAALAKVEAAGETPVILGTKEGPLAVLGLAECREKARTIAAEGKPVNRVAAVVVVAV